MPTSVSVRLQQFDGEHPCHLEDAQSAVATLAVALDRSIEETATAIIDTCNETMVRCVRKASLEQGFRPRSLTLVAFGGAGALHACDVAELIDIRTLIFPSNSGVLSAEGIACAQQGKLARRSHLPTKTTGNRFRNN